jgi:hypothetical protein
MPEDRYPTLEEFWKRLEVREVEDDLQRALRDRARREEAGTPRLGPERGAVAAAVAARLIPSAAVPAMALAAFLDWSFDRRLGRGDEAAGVMATPDLIPAGLDALELVARDRHGLGFAELDAERQDALLAEAERGDLPGPETPGSGVMERLVDAVTAEPRFDSSVWFKRTRGKLLLGYGSDPRGMVEMGFPGPSYKPGHIWLDRGEVLARVRRRRGYLEL